MKTCCYECLRAYPFSKTGFPSSIMAHQEHILQINLFPENLLQDFILCCKVFMCVTLTVFSFPVILFHKNKKRRMTSFYNRQLTSQPLHLLRGRRAWVSGAALRVSALRVSAPQSDRCQDLWQASMKQSITFETAFWLTAAPITKSRF